MSEIRRIGLALVRLVPTYKNVYWWHFLRPNKFDTTIRIGLCTSMVLSHHFYYGSNMDKMNSLKKNRLLWTHTIHRLIWGNLFHRWFGWSVLISSFEILQSCVAYKPDNGRQSKSMQKFRKMNKKNWFVCKMECYSALKKNWKHNIYGEMDRLRICNIKHIHTISIWKNLIFFLVCRI